MAVEILTSNDARRGEYKPDRPIEFGPLFQWPPKPLAFLKWLFGFPGYLWPWMSLFMGISYVSWRFFTPDIEEMKHSPLRGIVFLFIRNMLILVLFNSLWHWRLYVRKAQGTDYKYNGRWLSIDNPVFLFHNQLWDNVFWSCCSAVPIWTAYEVLTFRLQLNGFAPMVDWKSHPIYCALLGLLTPIWLSIHFYLIHRLIHGRWLYRYIHSLHHKNVNIGPWSGLAMHPLEHLLYFSAILLCWIIPCHPLNAVFLLQNLALGPALAHQGFDKLVFSKMTSLNTDHYMHYLHHKYVTVNFGVETVPLDKWFGTFHDGSLQAQEALKRRTRAKAARSQQPSS